MNKDDLKAGIYSPYVMRELFGQYKYSDYRNPKVQVMNSINDPIIFNALKRGDNKSGKQKLYSLAQRDQRS